MSKCNKYKYIKYKRFKIKLSKSFEYLIFFKDGKVDPPTTVSYTSITLMFLSVAPFQTRFLFFFSENVP